jgi:uroporphyrinogen decarboxylase
MMNGRELIYNSCNNIANPRPPIWLMRQAGRYMAEYRELRQKHSFMELCHNSDLACEITLQPIKKFDMDAAILFSDILVTAEALGAEVDIVEKQGPVISNPIRSDEDFSKLNDFSKANDNLAYIGKTLSKIRNELHPDKALLGFCGAPLTVASYMIEGGSSKDITVTFKMIQRNPELFNNIMTSLTNLTIRYIEMQRENGIDALQIFESWASLLPEAMYLEHVFPHLKKIIDTCSNPDKPLILFALAPISLWKHFAKLPVQVLSVPSTIPFEQIKAIAPDKAIQGNLDSRWLHCSQEQLLRETDKILNNPLTKKGFIFNLGHGITPKTPEENVAALCNHVMNFS